MNYLYPRIPANRLWAMGGISLLGAVIAGLYGAVHDQISFSISPEYFTKMKFEQFSYADLGFPPRVFASQVGFLATWWVGLFAGWFLARAGLVEIPVSMRWKCVARSFAIILMVTPIIGLLGVLLGVFLRKGSDLGEWIDVQSARGIEDIRAFVVVADLHLAGYVGAAIGLVLAIAYVRRCLVRSRRPPLMQTLANP
jgi:hypothetical protein